MRKKLSNTVVKGFMKDGLFQINQEIIDGTALFVKSGQVDFMFHFRQMGAWCCA